MSLKSAANEEIKNMWLWDFLHNGNFELGSINLFLLMAVYFIAFLVLAFVIRRIFKLTLFHISNIFSKYSKSD